MVVRPEDVGLPPPDHVGDGHVPGAPPATEGTVDDKLPVYDTVTVSVTPSTSVTSFPEEGPTHAISIFGALKIPGVVEFSICLFFAKAVSYTFLVCLPMYIKDIAGVANSAAGDLSAIFDAGGIPGKNQFAVKLLHKALCYFVHIVWNDKWAPF